MTSKSHGTVTHVEVRENYFVWRGTFGLSQGAVMLDLIEGSYGYR